jgi:hypothetical protein
MKIMISQPMNGKTEKQIKDERKYLVQELEEQGHEVIDTIIKNFDDEVSPIEFLDKADAIVFMKGWEDAIGCVIEHLIAEKYHKFIKEL